MIASCCKPHNLSPCNRVTTNGADTKRAARIMSGARGWGVMTGERRRG